MLKEILVFGFPKIPLELEKEQNKIGHCYWEVAHSGTPAINHKHTHQYPNPQSQQEAIQPHKEHDEFYVIRQSLHARKKAQRVLSILILLLSSSWVTSKEAFI